MQSETESQEISPALRAIWGSGNLRKEGTIMLSFETINELTLKVTCTGSDVLFVKAGAFIAGDNCGSKNYRFEKGTSWSTAECRTGFIWTACQKSHRRKYSADEGQSER